MDTIGIGDQINISSVPQAAQQVAPESEYGTIGSDLTETSAEDTPSTDTEIEEQSYVIDLGKRLYLGSKASDKEREGWESRAKALFL